VPTKHAKNPPIFNLKGIAILIKTLPSGGNIISVYSTRFWISEAMNP
jgi:hypothetical protein